MCRRCADAANRRHARWRQANADRFRQAQSKQRKARRLRRRRQRAEIQRVAVVVASYEVAQGVTKRLRGRTRVASLARCPHHTPAGRLASERSATA